GPLQVTSAKLQDGAVATEKLAGSAVTGPKIASGAVGSSQLASNAVTTEKIANGAITQAKLSFTPPSIARPITPGVAMDEIADGSVSAPKIVSGSITAAKLATDSVETAKIKAQAVTGAKIKDYDIGYTQIASNSINREKIINGEVLTEKIADGAVTEAKIAVGAVSADRLAGDAVTADKIAGNAVTPPKVDAVNVPADGQVLSYEIASSRFKYITPGGAGGMQLTLLPSQPMVFSENSMTDIDQLIDLSASIPVTAQAVIVEMQLNAMSVPVGMEQILTVFGRRGGSDYGSSTIHFIWQNLANLNQNIYKECILATDALRQIKVFIMKNGQFCSTNVWLKGYIE
ncbi:MAG: hypothetical protein WC980_08265, partial [Candidatus Brocadiia bacterium]